MNEIERILLAISLTMGAGSWMVLLFFAILDWSTVKRLNTHDEAVQTLQEGFLKMRALGFEQASRLDRLAGQALSRKDS